MHENAMKISVVDERMQLSHLITAIRWCFDKAFERHPPTSENQ